MEMKTRSRRKCVTVNGRHILLQLQLHFRHLFKASGIKLRHSFWSTSSFARCSCCCCRCNSCCCCAVFRSFCGCLCGAQLFTKLCKLSVLMKSIQRAALDARGGDCPRETRLGLFSGHCCCIISSEWLKSGYIFTLFKNARGSLRKIG